MMDADDEADSIYLISCEGSDVQHDLTVMNRGTHEPCKSSSSRGSG